jgi:hypothetical protein
MNPAYELAGLGAPAYELDLRMAVFHFSVVLQYERYRSYKRTERNRDTGGTGGSGTSNGYFIFFSLSSQVIQV